MAYNDDAVLSKLSSLNETHDSVAQCAQWIMFHRRQADRTTQLWLQRLRDSSSNKRLSLIYLANEVTQQSKLRRKDDFVIAFSPVIAEATAIAYKGANGHQQTSLKRVVEVWRERKIFEPPIQDAIEARVEELEKSRSGNKRGLAGGSLFSNAGSIPAELSPLVAPQQTISKLVLSTRTATNAATLDYDRITDPAVPIPTAPVYAARLNGLLRTLASAEGAVAESIKARKELIEGLERILDTNRTALATEETQLVMFSNRRAEIDTKKKEVEDSIMRGFSSSNPSTPIGPDGTPANRATPTPAPEVDRPEVEAFTPPGFPQDPPTAVPDFSLNNSTNGTSAAPIQHPFHNSPTSGLDLLSTVSTQYGRPPSTTPTASASAPKKRKLNDDFPDLGIDVLDADVSEMLRRDSGSNGLS